ncbi:hypothetical protein E1091_01115 [Micromonospora fluostatini]|uniref:Uncharacterized protein n=2 Tax=Micromonospora TaxID=1873 RepID=A0ABY2DLS0_9ACTN|nr:hypothetical protein E1091_01115 [Micromonospora fluostatini]
MKERARVAEQAFNATWAGRIRTQVTKAFRSIPAMPVRADTSKADKDLAALRHRLTQISSQRVGIDVDSKTAVRNIADVQAALARLAHSRTASIEVRVAAAQAVAELRGVDKVADGLDGRNLKMNVDVDVARALAKLREAQGAFDVNIGRLGALVVTVASLGPVLVPVAASVVGALGMIGASIAAVGVGIGTMVLGFSGIGEAVKRLNEYQENAAKSAVSVAAAQTRVASATDAVTSAQRSLANTRASAAEAERRSAEQIAEAERAVGDARRAAAEAVEAATRRVADSQRSLARVEAESRRVREALTEAYRDAQESLEDLRSSVQRNALDQRQANLEVAEAKQALDRILANPRATEEQREQARITYERQLLQIQDLQREGQRLADEQAEADRRGVEGSDEVVRARERLAEIDEQLAAAQRTLGDSREALVRAQLDGAQRVADAERRVAQAQRAAAEQQRQSMFQIQQAQQGVISSQRQLQQAIKASSVAGGEALDNLRKAMEELSPAGQEFARFLFGLKPELDELRATAQENLLPGVQDSIEAILPYLPQFNEFIGKVSRALGGLFRRTADVLTTDPTWRRFWRFIGDETVPTMDRLWSIGEKLSRGLAALFLELTSFNGSVGGGLESLADKFATWATTLDENEGFQKFLGFVRQEGPRVAELLKQLAIFAWRFVVAAAPIGLVVVEGLIRLTEALNKIPIDSLTIIIGAIGTAALVIGLFAAATAIAGASAGAFAAVVAVAVATAAALIIERVEWIQDWLLWSYNKIIKPTFEGIAWLLTDVVAPAFSWFYREAVRPIWDRVQIAFRIGAAAVQVAFGLFQIAAKNAGAQFRIFYYGFIEPIWRKIRPIFVKLGSLIEDEVHPKWDSGIKALGEIWSKLVGWTKEPIKYFVKTILNDGVLWAYNSVAKKFKVKPSDVSITLPPGWATGGPVIGPGTGTSDSILGRLSHGEHVWTAAEVAAAGGHAEVQAMRRAVLEGHTGAFRHGGPVGDGFGFGDLLKRATKRASDVITGVKDFFTDPAGTLRKLAEDLIKQAPEPDGLMTRLATGVTRSLIDPIIDTVKDALTGGDPGGPAGGPGNGLGGSRGMMRVLRTQFPDLQLISGYRPGSITLTGKQSYHALDRAVDVAPIRDVAAWIHRTWGRGTRELITPFQQFNLHNGKPHRYTGAVWNQHNFAGGNAHVHWAYDSGGLLPPGVSTVVNNTGRPEPVLNPWQWDQIATLARGRDEPREVHHWHFKNADLDHGRLAAFFDRRDAMARVGRRS